MLENIRESVTHPYLHANHIYEGKGTSAMVHIVLSHLLHTFSIDLNASNTVINTARAADATACSSVLRASASKSKP